MFKAAIIQVSLAVGLVAVSACALPTEEGEETIDVVEEAARGRSVHIKTVKIPPYNAKNKQHFLIKSNKDWRHINDANKRFFYVVPKKYGVVNISRSGTQKAPRMISLHNGNNTHPAKLAGGKQASVDLVFKGASNWVVDRLSSIGSKERSAWLVEDGSSNLVLNRLNFTQFRTAVGIAGNHNRKKLTRGITLQNSRLVLPSKLLDGRSRKLSDGRAAWRMGIVRMRRLRAG